MRGIIFIGGEGPEPEILKRIAAGADLLAAADSGLVAAEKAGLCPHWILGDMDSLDDPARLAAYPPGRVLMYPPDKDYTDTELAFQHLRKMGCGDITIAGGGGGRLDHLLAVRSLFEREDPPKNWYTANEEIHCLEAGMFLVNPMPEGSVVSVFPAGPGPWEAESGGLKWPLNGLVWKRDSVGVSNRAGNGGALNGGIEIRAVRGRFIVILPIYQNECKTS